MSPVALWALPLCQERFDPCPEADGDLSIVRAGTGNSSIHLPSIRCRALLIYTMSTTCFPCHARRRSARLRTSPGRRTPVAARTVGQPGAQHVALAGR